MYFEPALKKAILRVRDSIHKYAGSQGWNRKDYRIFMSVNFIWYKFIVTLMAKAFDDDDGDENARYDRVLDYLEDDLKDDPDLYESVSLLIYPHKGFDFYIPKVSAENWMDVDDSLLNPEVEDPHPIGHGS